jgi:sulfur-carrier protein
MAITILAFGQAADMTGGAEFRIGDVPDTDALDALLRNRFPGLQNLAYVMAVDQRAIGGNTPLQPSSVVALLPPFSGG